MFGSGEAKGRRSELAGGKVRRSWRLEGTTDVGRQSREDADPLGMPDGGICRRR